MTKATLATDKTSNNSHITNNGSTAKSPSASSSSKKRTSKKGKNVAVSPSKANGVYGFMFTSPRTKQRGGMVTAMNTDNHHVRRQLSFNNNSSHASAQNIVKAAIGGMVSGSQVETTLPCQNMNNTLAHHIVPASVSTKSSSLTNLSALTPNLSQEKITTGHEAIDATKRRRGRHANSEDDASSVLFSPYHLTPVKHRYFTRANAKSIEEQKLQQMSMEVDEQVVTMDIEETTEVINDKLVTKKHVEIHIKERANIEQASLSQKIIGEDLDLDITDLDTEEAVDALAWVYELSEGKSDYKGPVYLPPQDATTRNKMTLVLDLDETLVHCSIDRSKLPHYDIKFNVPFENRNFEVFAQKRPYVIEFLERASETFEVVIFTASQKIYADKLLDLMDPGRKWTKYRLFRDSCVPVDGTFVKDLRVLGRDLSRVIIVDNAVEAFSFQVENGIPIKSWFAEPEDNELPKLLNFLRPLAAAQQDVRPYLLQKFSMRERMIEARNQRKF